MTQVDAWLTQLGLSTINKSLIKIALTHSSYKGMGYKGDDNERLEFLGDAVLDLINAESLYKNKSLSEGQMTELRKKKVNNTQLADVFNILDMKNYIYVAKNLNLSNKVKADFVEAFFGAIYLDKGYAKCVKIWNHLQNLKNGKNGITKGSKLAVKPQDLKNAKSLLAELCQKYTFSQPEYTLINKKGPDHDPLFIVRVLIHAAGNPADFRSIFGLKKDQKLRIFADGTAKKKKEAEMIAAHNLYMKLKKRK